MRGRIIMERITGRIINKFKNKEYDIFIIHNTKEYRFLIDREKINVKNYSIGDIVECTGNNFVGDCSDEYSEYFCDKIKMIKQTLLTTNECAISNQNKFNGTKERIYFHTKMITDKNCIKKMFVFDNVLKSIRKNLESRCFL